MSDVDSLPQDADHAGPWLMPGSFVDPSADLAVGVRIGPNAVVLSGASADKKTSIASGAEVGANATIGCGVTIGTFARVEPGAVVNRSVPPFSIVEGNPARITGYVNSGGKSVATPLQEAATQIMPSRVQGVVLHHTTLRSDMRGSLCAGECFEDVPFTVKRYFIVFDVPSGEVRGEHAHIQCEQFLVAVKGSIRVVADDGQHRQEFILDRPNLGLYLPPMVWGTQYHYSPDAALLVLASEAYDAADYIRSYDTFLERRQQN